MDKNAAIDMASKVGRVVGADIKVSTRLVPNRTFAYEQEDEESKERQTTRRSGRWSIQIKATSGPGNETIWYRQIQGKIQGKREN